MYIKTLKYTLFLSILSHLRYRIASHIFQKDNQSFNLGLHFTKIFGLFVENQEVENPPK